MELSIKIIDKSRKVVPFSKEPLFFILLNVPWYVHILKMEFDDCAAFVADFVYSVMTCVVDYMEAHLLSNKE